MPNISPTDASRWLYCTGFTVPNDGYNLPSDPAAWGDGTVYSQGQTLREWLRHMYGSYVMLSSSLPGINTNTSLEARTVRETAAAWSASIGNRITGENAHTPPEGFAWIGLYYPVVDSDGDIAGYVPQEAIERGPFNCPHCAVVSLATSHPGQTVTTWLVSSHVDGTQRSQIPSEMMPQIPETMGGVVVSNGMTVKSVTAPLQFGCGTCGRIGHNARTCNKGQHVHQKIGIEIEGRWNTTTFRNTRTGATNDGLGGCADGSVRSRNGFSSWEFQTVPGTLRESLQQLIKYYPDNTGPDCGMHVHVSFPCIEMSLLCTNEFFAYFKTRWNAWGLANRLSPTGEFFRRLNGNNDYCNVMNEHHASMNDMTQMDRYTQLNFGAWLEHKTVECRLLPMFQNQDLAVSAVQELLDIYETFLADPALFGLILPDVTTTLNSSIPIEPLTQVYDFPELAESTETFTREIAIVDLPPVRPGFVRIPAVTVYGDRPALRDLLRAA